MNRRGFLGLLGGAAAVILIGELPTSKTFFLPPAGGWNLRNSLTDFAAYCDRHGHLDYMADGQRIARAMAESLGQTKWMVQARVLGDIERGNLVYAAPRLDLSKYFAGPDTWWPLP